MLDGSESQYSGMQIGTLQDEEEEGAAPQPDKPPEPFSQSALGTHTHFYTSSAIHPALLVILLAHSSVFSCRIALSKPHLLEGKGHNRQSSDSSVDRFIPKEEVLEPAELDNKVNMHIKKDVVHLKSSQILYRELKVKLYSL